MSSSRIKRLIFGACLAASAALTGAAIAADRDDNTPSQALNNSNRSPAADRDTGNDRAADRMSQQGLEHSQAQARNNRANCDRDHDMASDRDHDKLACDRDKDRDHPDQDR